MKRIITLLLAACMVMALAPAIAVSEAAPLDPYTFEIYYNYDWWTIKPWGGDEASKYWQEKFNITMEQTKPDADASAKLNLMVSAGDLPDVIQMDRGPDHSRLASLGIFIDLQPLMDVNPTLSEEILESTRDLLKVNDTLYSIPHWARKGPTGGNDVWMYDLRLYEQAGSPDLTTFEGLYEYAKYVKDNIPETVEGLPTIPFATENNNNAWDKIVFAFYRSFGGPNWAADRTAHIGGELKSVLRDGNFKDAVLEANKWYREGLVSPAQFTDTNDQMVEKFVSGRTALLYYDHSQDSVNRFRQILMNSYPDDTYTVLTDPVYPTKAGVTKVYPDQKETLGWNVLCITTAAEQPQRIYDLYSYLLTKQGSIEMMYGPQGDWWDELDENGNPVLKTPESVLSTEEKDRIGAWFWNFCSHSDNVDSTKYAVNAMQPPELQDFVITTQDKVLTDIMFMTDEYAGLNATIDPLSDVGIARTLCDEQWKAELPKIIMAGTEEEASALYDALLKFFEDNGFAQIEEIYNARHQELVEIQGYTAYAEYGN
ncbi:MAG: extracellular solute-binding protein [Oscillospiraceae bacterium]|nr:extracellular solute-binding protein [Oscillospiraceae bacterium]